MSFAKSQLQKHGWVEGSGLGRNEHGIKEAIKVKIKHDSAGVGHNQADEFTFHWWDHVFNKAASNINVENSEDGVNVNKKSAELSISTKKTSAKTFANKDMLYGRFIKAATLTQEGSEVAETPHNSGTDSDDSADEDVGTIKTYSDQELMKACGGRTAHKGARHGLGLNGKLSRVEEQDQAYVKSLTDSPVVNVDADSTEVTRKSKKDKKRKREKESEGSTKRTEKEKKAKKSEEKSENCDSPDIVIKPQSEENVEDVKPKKCKKKKNKVEIDLDSQNTVDSQRDEILEDEKPRKSKKKKNKRKAEEVTADEPCVENGLCDETEEAPIKKSKKKKKSKETDCDKSIEEEAVEVETTKKLKKKKKSKDRE